MAKRSMKAFMKKENFVTLQLSWALAWRVCTWSYVLKFLAIMIMATVVLPFAGPVMFEKETILKNRSMKYIVDVVISCTVCYLTLESLLSYGYKSGRYQLQVHATSNKKLKR